MNESPSKARRARLRSVTVTAIQPSKYPQFCQDRENPFSSQTDEVRMAEIVDICGTVLAQSGFDGKASAGEVKAA
jgi:hypothetical protein